MTAPLSHYYIYIGHNSYLSGNQHSSDAGDVPIIKALNEGVRVIELDIWPNSTKDDVDVLHGRTSPTAPVELIQCLRSIKEHAFVASSYPAIIILEDHLTPDLQAKVAEVEAGNIKHLSLSEQALEKPAAFHGIDLVRFTQKNMLRIYPKGTRVNSTNYNPLIGWTHGAQVVAFNIQGYGWSLLADAWFFQSQFGKPDSLMKVGENNEVFNPIENLQVKKTLKVRVYIGDGWCLDFKQTHFDSYCRGSNQIL